MIMTTAKVGFAAALGAIALAAAGPGFAQADPNGPPQPPVVPAPGVPSGPGGTAGPPGKPLPPGQGYLPPAGHHAQIDEVVPAWAPPAPPPPLWAPWLPVVWNADLPAWGVWWNGGFIQL